MQLAALLLLQSLSFNSSSGLTPQQISWLNPLGLPTAARPTIPDCAPGNQDWRCELMYDPTSSGDVLIPTWAWLCRHGWCPWDEEQWAQNYEDTCGFYGDCEDTPGWVEPTWELPHHVVTPEPASLVLLGTGLAGVAAAVRRKKRNVQDRRT